LEVIKLNECGYEESAFGFSLSYNTSVERSKEILSKYAFGKPGENKFLRSIHTWWDIKAPRGWLTEMDTYKISTVRLSESTMHTIMKKELSNENFELPLDSHFLEILNRYIHEYQVEVIPESKKYKFLQVKNHLPEGFLQRIMFECNYATLQTIYIQRNNHRLPQWHVFIDSVLAQVDFPEFIVKDYNKGV
jgi:hypothetical protein